MHHFILLLCLLLSGALTPAPPTAVAAPPATAALKNCPRQCGSVSLPYPFGFRNGCYRPGFQVECNSSSDTPMIRLPGTKMARNKLVAVTNVSLDVVTVQLGVAEYCGSGVHVTTTSNGQLGYTLNTSDLNLVITELESSPYVLSYTRNKFVVLGCFSFGYLFLDIQPAAVCAPTCTNKSDIVNGSCSVLSGCCQSIIPKSMKNFFMYVQTMDLRFMNATPLLASPCHYAFVTDIAQYEFRSTDVSDYFGSRRSRSVPVALDWAIGNYSCSSASTSPGYACGANAHCEEATNGPGYRCKCNSGYTGNPYLADGCQDINECDDPQLNTCSKICINTIGNFTCSCPRGTYGDGLKERKGCIYEERRPILLEAILGSCLGFLLLLLCFTIFLKKQKLIRMREKFFEQNGGLIMRNIILSQDSATQFAKIFSEEELMKATNNYSHNKIIGKGGCGTVYKGTLSDMTIIAIKKSILQDKRQVEQFINEIVILSQIKHRNVVNILGCCLDSQVPLLVYEYVPNGTLFYHIHDLDRYSSLSWQARLRIAREIADAISYLHSFASQSIIHRDIKSSNILLDDNYSVKVADFGISKIIPFGVSEETTKLQGTRGYMDPESFETGQLTKQSDVYSFGVILAELLTGQMPILTINSEITTLASYFSVSMKENKFFDIVEPRVQNEGHEGQLQMTGNLVMKCLMPNGIERPSMRDVAAELNKLQTIQMPMTFISTKEVQSIRNEYYSSIHDSPVVPLTGTSSINTEVQGSTISWQEYIR